MLPFRTIIECDIDFKQQLHITMYNICCVAMHRAHILLNDVQLILKAIVERTHKSQSLFTEHIVSLKYIQARGLFVN